MSSKRSSGKKKSTPSRTAFINFPETSSRLHRDSKVHVSREGSSFIHERCHLDSSYYGNQKYKTENLSADVKSYEPPHFYDHFRSVSNCYAIPPLCRSLMVYPRKYVSFIRKFHAIISSKDEPQLRIHYLIKGEAAESIEHCVSFEPLEGYVEALRILETLFGNPRVISNVSISRLTKGPSIQFLDSKGLLKLSEDMRACSCTLSNLEAYAEFNSPNVINSIVKLLPPQLQAWWYERVFKHMSELTEFIATKGQATTFCIDYLPNVRTEEIVATE